jgi:monofunctional biosynthetic peptidoglycan transglycosylase
VTGVAGRGGAARRVVRRLCWGAGGALAAWLLWTWATWPDVAALARANPRSTAFIDRARADGVRVRWAWVPDSRISVHLRRAVVAAEDMEFFSHDGFSRAEIRAAVQEALREGRLRGASTITQQLAKNLWLSPSRDPLRKLREILLTRQLEAHLSKRRILEIYLNVAELGPGVYGAEAAAQHYFGTPAAALSERQAAELAASLPRPGTWHPGAASGAYRRYVADVLRRMDRADFLWRHVRAP